MYGSSRHALVCGAAGRARPANPRAAAHQGAVAAIKLNFHFKPARTSLTFFGLDSGGGLGLTIDAPPPILPTPRFSGSWARSVALVDAAGRAAARMLPRTAPFSCNPPMTPSAVPTRKALV